MANDTKTPNTKSPGTSKSSGSPIDTGPGGFDIDGQTYVFDVGLEENDGGQQGPRQETVDVSDGYLDGSGRPKDLTQKTKTKLADYLSQQTSGKGPATQVPNRYPVDPGLNELSTTTKSGNPSLQSPGAPAPTNSRVFAPDESRLSSLSSAYTTISDKLRKGKSDSPGTDGNDLLLGVGGVQGRSDTTSVVAPYVSSIMSSNRFSDASRSYISTPAYDRTGVSSEGDIGFNPTLTRQGTLGSYNPQAPTIKLGQLAAIGPLLTMRAGKELNTSDTGADPNEVGIQAGAILPGIAQLGIDRVSPQALYAADVLAQFTKDDPDVPSGGAFVTSPSALSWGQLNNVGDPFTGTDALGMLALSTALVGSLEVVFDALSILLGLITPSVKKPSRDGIGRYSLGEYYPGSKTTGAQGSRGGIGGAVSSLASLNFGGLLGILPTSYPFSRALVAGMNAFFGIPDSKGGGIGLNQLLGAFTSAVDSPGFNVVVCRAIVRSTLSIADAAKKIGGNPFGAGQVLSLIDSIRASKIVSACNVFASLGDALLSVPSNYVDSASSQVKISDVDSRDDVGSSPVSKSRLKGTLKLAWAGNRAPSNVLLPNNIFALSLATKNMGQPATDAGLRKDPFSLTRSSVVTASDTGRIDPELAAQFENELEASYVPFYFHDVRTNEMISFHAFIASLTDDYTAAYNKSEAFGRVEAVKTYKSTERRISMSFYVVATSPLDFDEMWVKINKLVTLVYPQYTAGVQMSDPTGQAYQINQPFSQLIGASPLVRIRLGDLIRSNYSVFAVGRLFGMGNPNFAVDSQKFTDVDKVDQATLDAYEKAINEMFSSPDGSKTFYPDPNGTYDYVDPASALGGVSLSLGDNGPKFAPVFTPRDSQFSNSFAVKVKCLDPDNPLIVIGEVQSNTNTDYVEVNFNNTELPKKRFIGGTYRFPIGSLSPTEKSVSEAGARLTALAGITPDSAFGQALADFMSPRKNAITKSFQDTGGKGLAGFIETMSFDWYDKTTWEIGNNRTAPKMCKVNISFSPIHDISPGIDHNGYNRAAIYPVGAMARGPMPFQSAK